MDYLSTYYKIINNAKNKNRSGYLELHHIIPKCIFGENLLSENEIEDVNQDSNLVYLKAREHFVCHWLLHRAFPNNKKLGLAFWAMAGMISPEHKRDYTPSSRAIAEARIAAANGKKTPVLQYDLEGNFIQEFESLNAASNAVGVVPNAIGQNLNSFLKSAGGFQWCFKTKNYSHKIEPYVIDNNGLPIGQYDLNGNLIASYESLLQAERKTGHTDGSIRAAMNRGAKLKDSAYFFIQYNKHQEIPKLVEPYVNPLHGFMIPVVQLSADGKYFINKFPSIIHAEKFFNIKKSHISNVCKGKRKTALGYKWLYKSDYINQKPLPKISLKDAKRKIYSKPVAQYNLDGKYIKKYKNLQEAAKSSNCLRSNLIAVIKGRRNSSGGYIWAYIENNKIPNVKPVMLANNKAKEVLMIDIKTNKTIRTFDSVAQAAGDLKVNRSNISACINGRKKTAYGFKWAFK